MVVKTFGSALHGVEAFPITIEVSSGRGLHTFLVGLPDNVIKESLMRLEIAITGIGKHMPRNKVVINMAPADLQKTGSGFDLPLALGVLAASGQIENHELLKDFMIIGELGLDGSIQPIKGALPMAICARDRRFKGIILPKQNVREASLVKHLNVFGMEHLNEAVEFFDQYTERGETVPVSSPNEFQVPDLDFEEDFSDVKGQECMKRVLEIAAAGGHNVLFIGPPGSSKTMLASRIPTILPPLTVAESLETTRLYSVAGMFPSMYGLISHRPYRAPHHTISSAGLAGGGSIPQPGEISLAHNGVLFLDELPEFKRSALEVLRQPLEEKKVTISRAKMTLQFPSSFMLITSMNPCPCGYYQHPTRKCSCSPYSIKKYLAKISGPLLDRIDLQLKVSPVPFYELNRETTSETSGSIRTRVVNARKLQEKRNSNEHGFVINANLGSKQVQQFCELDEPSRKLLYKSMESLHLSARAYERILKVCRTIADLAASEAIKIDHVAEAIHYRSLDYQMHEKLEKPKIKKLVPLPYMSDDELMILQRLTR